MLESNAQQELIKALREPEQLQQVLSRLGADENSSELQREEYNCEGRMDRKGVLHCAVLSGCIESVNLLLDCNAPVDDNDECGRTPLLQACMEGYHEIADLLINCGAKVNVQDQDGFNAAHWAFCMGHDDLGYWLLEKCGVDASQVDAEGRRPIDLAEQGTMDDESKDSDEEKIDSQQGKSSAFVINGEVNNFAAGSGFRAIKWLAVNIEDGGVFPCDEKASVE